MHDERRDGMSPGGWFMLACVLAFCYLVGSLLLTGLRYVGISL